MVKYLIKYLAYQHIFFFFCLIENGDVNSSPDYHGVESDPSQCRLQSVYYWKRIYRATHKFFKFVRVVVKMLA